MEEIRAVLKQMAAEVARMVLEGSVRAGESQEKGDEILAPVVDIYTKKIKNLSAPFGLSKPETPVLALEPLDAVGISTEVEGQKTGKVSKAK